MWRSKNVAKDMKFYEIGHGYVLSFAVDFDDVVHFMAT